MSVFNGAEYVGQAVESILNQTFHDFEFIIVDDGSTDKTPAIIGSFTDSRIRIIRNESNLGLPRSLNKGIKEANGMYLARQDADDISDKLRLEKQLKKAEVCKSDLLGCALLNIDISGNLLSISSIDDFDKLDKKKLLSERRMLFAHGSAFIRKNSLEEVGFYNEGLFYAQDAELWMRFIDRGMKISYLSEPRYCLRRMPIKNDKKVVGQKAYMECLRGYYILNNGHRDGTSLDMEIQKINDFLDSREPVQYENYLSDYWHYCSTTCLIESRNKRQAFKYIIKAIKEKKSFVQFVSHLIVLSSMILPFSLLCFLGKRKQ